MHELLALSMEILHFESFLYTQENASDICNVIRRELETIKQHKNIDSHSYTKEMDDVLQQYNVYSIDTQNRKNGKKHSVLAKVHQDDSSLPRVQSKYQSWRFRRIHHLPT